TMADMNMPANDVPAEQAPAIAPPTRTDDQILPSSKWVPIGKSNCVLDVQKSQRNPIFPIVVAILKNTNFFRAFTASSTILAIYIQHCQLDEKWFNLHKDILRDALDITPSNDNNPFVAPPSSDTVIEYVNTLGYPCTLRNGITHRSNIDYAERIWEEFVQSIQTFLTDRKNLATASRGKKKTAHLLIPNVRFTKLIIHHLKNKHNIHPRPGSALHYSHEENILNTLRYVGKDGREIFGMPIPDALLTDAIKSAPYYNSYLEDDVTIEYQRYLNEEHDKADDKSPEPASSQPPKPTPTPTESSKKDQGKKRKLVMESTDAPSPAKRSKAGKVTKKRMPKSSLQLVDEVVDEGVPEKEPAHDDEEANLQRALELSLKEQGERTQGPARPVVIREPDSGRIHASRGLGNGKKRFAKEQVASRSSHSYTTSSPKNPADQFIFQRRTPMPTEPSEHADSPSLDAELALTDSETESEEEVPVIKAGDQDEGQAGPNPGEQDEGQAGSNPGDAAESQPQPSHVENLKLLTEDQVILEEPASSTGTLSSLQNLDKDLSFTDQFFVEKPQEEEPGKTNAEAEVQSMVSVPIHQDTSSVPPMTTPVIDLTKSQSDSPLPTSTATTSTITTTTTLPPPPLQSTTDLILVRRIGELEQHIADLIQNNLALEERLDKHGSRLYKLENLNIPHQVSKVVDEIVTDAVDWAMQAPLRARFRDLPTVDMKEILQQRMFEDNTYKTHEVHNDLYEALQKSVELDYSNQRLADQEEARKKKRKRRESPRTPPGSPPTQPPLPPPPAGASGAPGSKALSSSKTAASASQSMAWMTSDTQYKSADIPGLKISKEERPTTLKPAWTIPSSNKSNVVNNWASVLAITYEPPAENSLLVKIRDMTTFMNWYCQKVNKTVLMQVDFEGQAYEVVKAFYPDVIHLQFQM
ncbi:retrovirus-related pol polyprotein from transposon TNT 1-94, partial [Tanacetum coccineum]